MSKYHEERANWYNQRRGNRDDSSNDPHRRDARLQPDRRQARMVSSSPYGREAATSCRTERRSDWTPVPNRDRRVSERGWYEHTENRPPYLKRTPAERGSSLSGYDRYRNIDRYEGEDIITVHGRQTEPNTNERLTHRRSRKSVDDMSGAYQPRPVPEERGQNLKHDNERPGRKYIVCPDGDFSGYQRSRQVSGEQDGHRDFDYRYTHQPEKNTSVNHRSRKTSTENRIEVYDYEHKSTLQANYTSSFDLTGSTQNNVSGIGLMDTLHKKVDNAYYKADRFGEDNSTVSTDSRVGFQDNNHINGPQANPTHHVVKYEPDQMPSRRVNLDEAVNLHHLSQEDRPAVSNCIPNTDENKASQLQDTMVNIQNILCQLKTKLIVPTASDTVSNPNTEKKTPAGTPVVIRSSSKDNMKTENVQEYKSNSQLSKMSEVIDLTDDSGTGYIQASDHSDSIDKVTAIQNHIQYTKENPPRQPINMMPYPTNTYSSNTDACVDIPGISQDQNKVIEQHECNLNQYAQQTNAYGGEKDEKNFATLENDCNIKKRFQSGENYRNGYTGYQRMATPHRQRHSSNTPIKNDFKGRESFGDVSQQKVKQHDHQWHGVGKDMHTLSKQTSNEHHTRPTFTQTYGSSKGFKNERKHEKLENQGKDFNLNRSPVDQVFKGTIVKKEPNIKTEQISPKTRRIEESDKSIVGPNTRKSNHSDDDSNFVESKKSFKDFRIPKIRRESSESFKASTKKVEKLETTSFNSKVSNDKTIGNKVSNDKTIGNKVSNDKTIGNKSADEKEEKGLIPNKSPDGSAKKDVNTMTVKKSPEIKENIFEKMSLEILHKKNIKDIHQSDTDLHCKNLEWCGLDKALTEKDKHCLEIAKKGKHSMDNKEEETNLKLASNKEEARSSSKRNMIAHEKSATCSSSTTHSSESEDSNSSVDSNCSGIFGKLEKIINKDKKKKKEDDISHGIAHKKDRKKTSHKLDRKLDECVTVKGLTNAGGHMYWKNIKLLNPKIFVKRLTRTDIHNIQKDRLTQPQEDQGMRRLALTESTNSLPGEQDNFSQEFKRQASPVLSDSDLSFSLEDGINMELGSDDDTLRQCLVDMQDDPALLDKEADQSCNTTPGTINKDIKEDKSITVPVNSDSKENSHESQSNHNPLNSCKSHLDTSNVHDKNKLISRGDSKDRTSQVSIVENSDEFQRKGQIVVTGSNQCAENSLCDTRSCLSGENDLLNTDSPVCVISVQMDDEEESQSILDNSTSIQINQEDGMIVGSKMNDRANSTTCSEKLCEGDNYIDKEDSSLLNKAKKSLECKTIEKSDRNSCDISEAREYMDDGLPIISSPKKMPRSKGMTKGPTGRTSFGSDMPTTASINLSKNVTSAFDNNEIEGTISMVPVKKKKIFKSGSHIPLLVKEETGHEGDVEDNILNNETEDILNDETKLICNAGKSAHSFDDKSEGTDSNVTQPYRLSQTDNEGTCINKIQMDTSLDNMIDTKTLEIKEEPNWMRNGYTQEPDTVFISDDDDNDMVMSVSQPIIDLCDSESENEDVEKKRISESKVDVKKEFEDIDIHDPDYWACSSPEDYSDKSDFDDFFKMVSRLSEPTHSDTEDQKSDGLSDNEPNVFSDDDDSLIASLKNQTNETEGYRDNLKTDNLISSSIHDEPTQLFMSSEGKIESHSQPLCSQTQIEENEDVYMQDTQVDFDSTENDSNQISALEYHSEFFADQESLSDLESEDIQNQTVSKSHVPLNQGVEDNGSRIIFIEDMPEGESLVSSDLSDDSDALFDFPDTSEQSTQKYVMYDSADSKGSDKIAAGTLYKHTYTKSYDSNSMKNMKQKSYDSKGEKIQCLDDEDDRFGAYSSATQIDKNFQHTESPSTSRPEIKTCAGYETETQDLNHDEVDEYDIATQVDGRNIKSDNGLKERQETGDSLDEIETQTFDCQVDDYFHQTQIDENVFTSYHAATQVMTDSEDYTDPQYELYLQTSSGEASSSVNDKLGIKIDHYFHTYTKKLIFSDDHVYVDKDKQPKKEKFSRNFVRKVTPSSSTKQCVDDYMEETQVDHYSSGSSTDEETSTEKATDCLYAAQTQCLDKTVPPSRKDTYLDAYLQETQVDIDLDSGGNDREEAKSGDDLYLSDVYRAEESTSSTKPSDAYLDQTQVDLYNINNTDYDQQDPYIAATQVSAFKCDNDSNDVLDENVYDLATQMDVHEAYEVQSSIKVRTTDGNDIVRKRSISIEDQSTSTAYSATSHTKSNTNAEGIPMKKKAKLGSCEKATVSHVVDSSLTETDLQVQQGPLPRSNGFLDARRNILVIDASKDDTWLSKKASKDKGKQKSVPRKRSKSGDSSVDIKARINEARSRLEERKMRFIANPDCIANPNKKQKSSTLVTSTKDALDVDYPTLSQVITKGYPILESAMLHHPKPASKSVSGFTAEVTTSISTIVTRTVTTSISTVSSTSSSNIHATSKSICVASSSSSNQPSTKTHSSASSAGNQLSTKTHSSASSASNQPSTKTHSSVSSAGNQPSFKSHSSSEVQKSSKEASKDKIKTYGIKSRSHKDKNQHCSSYKDRDKNYESDKRGRKEHQHDGSKESRHKGNKGKDKKHGSDKSEEHKHSHHKDRKDKDGRDKNRDQKLEESSRSSGSSGKSRDVKRSYSSDNKHSLYKSSRSSSSIQSSSNETICHKSDNRESGKNDATNTRMNTTEMISKKQDNSCDKPSIDSLKSSDVIEDQSNHGYDRISKKDAYVRKPEQSASGSSRDKDTGGLMPLKQKTSSGSSITDGRGKTISVSEPTTMEYLDNMSVKQRNLKDANMSSSKETIACTSLSTPTGLTNRVNIKVPQCVPRSTSNQGGPISSDLKTAVKSPETNVGFKQPVRNLQNVNNIKPASRPPVNNKPVTSETLSLGNTSSSVSQLRRVDEQLPPNAHGKVPNRVGLKKNLKVTWSDNVVNPNERQKVSTRYSSPVYPSTSANNLMLKIPHTSPLVPGQIVTYPPDLMQLTNPVVWGKIIAVILKWNPAWFMERDKMEAGGVKRCTPPPVNEDLNDAGCETLFPLVDRYTSLEEYTNKFMLPLLMHETWHSIYTDWREKKNKSQLHKLPMFLNQICSSGEKLQEEYSFIGLVTCEERKRWGNLNEGDLITLRMYGKQNVESIEKTFRDIMGVVVVVTFKHSKAMLDKICSQNAKLAKLIRPDSAQVILRVRVRKRTFVPSNTPEDPLTEIQPLSSIVAIKRQIDALASFPRSPLCRDLLYPSANSTYSDRAVASLPHDRKKLNESQSVAVNTAVKIVKHVSAVVPKICLLQGPPGTGKSYTIINIIRRIVQENQGKCRICLTAPSHAAVDELLRKIHRMNTESENKVKINMVRLGKKHSVHPEVHRYCLDNLVQQRARGKIPQSLEAERSSLENKICSVLKNIKGSKDRYQVQKWTNDLKRLRKDKENLDVKFQTNENPINAGTEKKIKWELLTGAHVIAGTLSSMGGHLLKMFLPKTNTFDCIIIDEATQATELDTLIPLQYSTSKLILVGDPEQLCPTVLSQTAQDNKLNMSLFQRLDNYFRYSVVPSHQVILLDTQYRMNTEIASFPNSYIYEGKLKSNTEHMNCNLVPYLLFDIREGKEQFSQGSRSMSNQMEAVFTAELCKFILKETKFQEKSIGIIAPYSKQKAEIRQKLAERGFHCIEVSTVDGFQGREKPIVIMSCVRAVSGSIGFVGNRNRMNVALTRAKYAMYLVGHFGALGSSDEWQALIADARQRNKIVSVSNETYLQNIGSCLKKYRGSNDRIAITDT